MTPDYASLDAAIVKAIRDGHGTFRELMPEVRMSDIKLDGRLQILMKRGIIVYNNGRWSAVEKV